MPRPEDHCARDFGPLLVSAGTISGQIGNGRAPGRRTARRVFRDSRTEDKDAIGSEATPLDGPPLRPERIPGGPPPLREGPLSFPRPRGEGSVPRRPRPALPFLLLLFLLLAFPLALSPASPPSVAASPAAAGSPDLAPTNPLVAFLRGRERVVRYGYPEHPPIFFSGPSGEAEGFLPDLLRLVAAREGWRIEFVRGSGEELVSLLREGRIDLLSMAPTPRLDELFDFSREPVFSTWYTLFTLPRRQVDSLARLDGKRIGLQGGFYASRELRDLVAQTRIRCEIREYPTTREAFLALTRGEVDACAAEQLAAMPLAREYQVRRSPIVFAPSQIYFGTTKGRNRELLEALDRRLRSLRDREDSPYYLYRSRWFYDEDLTVFPRWGIALILGGAALILLLAALATIWALKEGVIRRQSRLLSRCLRYERALSACARLLFSGGELPETLRLFRERLGKGSEALSLSIRRRPAPDVPETEFPGDDRPGPPLGEGTLPLSPSREEDPPPDPSGGPRVIVPLLEGQGRYGELIATYRPGFSPNEEERTFLSAGADLIGAYLERHRAEARLRELARTDPLTGIANRRTLFEEADREIRRCLRRGRPLAFALLDVDRFKDVNDGFGHDAGDRILRELARILAEGLRSEDLVGRLGGEEFGLLLPETDLPGAFLTMERLRSAVEETPFALHGEGSGDAPPETIRITVSLGLALLAPAEAGFEPLYRRADQALYRAKSLGRNRVVTEDLLSAPSSSAPRPAEESPSLLSGPRGRS